jgi:hypothetical protein
MHAINHYSRNAEAKRSDEMIDIAVDPQFPCDKEVEARPEVVHKLTQDCRNGVESQEGYTKARASTDTKARARKLIRTITELGLIGYCGDVRGRTAAPMRPTHKAISNRNKEARRPLAPPVRPIPRYARICLGSVKSNFKAGHAFLLQQL